ncbi:MAG TPA: hypothetical protein VF944_04500 [Candidatus Bathyarchaeia archaeon]
MAWPTKIFHGGRGSGRALSGVVPRPVSDRKRDFMQKAVLAMLASETFSQRGNYLDLITRAENLFEEIERRCK